MKFLAQQLIGAATVSWGVFVADVGDWPRALGYGIAAVGLSISFRAARMKLLPVTMDLGIEFDTAQFDWWKPIGRTWCLYAAGISVLYGARVGVLGLQLVASIEFYDRDALDRDDQVRAGVDEPGE